MRGANFRSISRIYQANVKIFIGLSEYKPKMNFSFPKAISPNVFSCRKKTSPVIFVVLLLVLCALPNFAQDEDEDSAEAVKIFNLAQDAHEKGDLAGAIKFYDEAIKRSLTSSQTTTQKACMVFLA